MLDTVGLFATYALAGVIYYGGFSRFTHGQYTPAFYQYQLERAPNNADTRFIPFVDMIIGTLLLFSPTRKWVASFFALVQGAALVVRLKDGLPVAPDVALFSLSVIVIVSSMYRKKQAP